ncbi:DUF559 domain-containing protein [Nonomuraea sp. NPDC050310]|uniref:endonuclease domain-containing protein n=1 Tax=Nonomuraea sp. NPDC050310 TaxID=3154935 RepID=UPI0033F88ECC
MTLSWAELPVGRAVRLTGGDADALALAVNPLPDRSPAIAVLAPPGPDLIDTALAEIERACLALFPAWLPGAEGLRGSGGAGPAAARSLALELSRRTSHFGPWLGDLAERALTGGPGRRFPVETRAAGLAKVLAASYGRKAAALLVRVPPGLSPSDEHRLVSGASWLAQRGRFGVWLAGAELREAVERAPVGTLEPSTGTGPPDSGVPGLFPALTYPAVAGRPHPGSAAERALEAALATRPWAEGREWNRRYHPAPLREPIHPDLLWPAERCIVEIDGPDHRGAAKFARDRRRDVLLQLDGFAVLRFTNHDVLTDVATVLAQIATLLHTRRRG